MCWKKRPRRSVLAVITCAVTYVGVVNLLAFYSMVRSYDSPVSWVQRYGHMYIGKTETNNWICKGLRYSTIPLPPTALVSFPGSGNTWLRHVIQQATGVATGSAYTDVSLKRDGFPGEGQTNGSVIVVKTHFRGQEERARYVRAILLIRDPFNALLSEFNRRHGGHRGHAPNVNFEKNWYDYILGTAGEWYDLYHDWLTFDGPIHVIMYGDLRSNPLAELDRLMKFLGVTLTHKEKFCVMSNYEVYIENVRRAQDTVVLVTVPEYHSIFNGSILFTDPATVAVLVKEEEKRIQQILQKYTRKMRDANIGGKLREDVGKAGETILSVAQEENASLIVVGSRGIGKIRRTILGSVSDYCLHHSTVPVLICRMEV